MYQAKGFDVPYHFLHSELGMAGMAVIISTILTYGLSDSIVEDCERKMRNWRNW